MIFESAWDPEVSACLKAEWQRQASCLELIASENHASLAVMAAQGSVLTNKYAEGYPGRRYYGGCEVADRVETLAIERAKALFGADHVNVQPHSGSQANAAAYMALMQPGDTFMGMGLSDGGHLTHGARVSFSGRFYRAITYGVRLDTGLLDWDAIRDTALRHRPKVLVAGCSAYARVIDWSQFRAIADEVGAALVVDMAHVAGLVAAGLHPSPLGAADVVTSTTHKTLRGPRGGLILARQRDPMPRFDAAIFPGLQGGPLMHTIAAKAVAFEEARQASFKVYQQQVVTNARAMASVLMARGYTVISGGTDNHMVLVSLCGREVTGRDAERALEQARIIVNKNTVPGDPRSPFVTSGLRIGTPAVTTRGLTATDCAQVAHWIADVLDNIHDSECVRRVAGDVQALCEAYPVYPPGTEGP